MLQPRRKKIPPSCTHLTKQLEHIPAHLVIEKLLMPFFLYPHYDMLPQLYFNKLRQLQLHRCRSRNFIQMNEVGQEKISDLIHFLE